MDDDGPGEELSFGRPDDAVPPHRQSTWAAATVAIALAAGLLGWRVGRSQPDRADAVRRTDPPGATVSAAPTPNPSRPTSSPSPRPTGFNGTLVRGVVGLDVVVGGERPAVIPLGGGSDTAISGLPKGAHVDQLVRLSGRTLVLAIRPGADMAQTYLIADGTTAARAVPDGAGQLIAPGRSGSTFWLLARSDNRTDRWEERDLSGRVLRTMKYRPNRMLVRGVVGGVLIAVFDETGTWTDLYVWDPDRNRRVRSFPTARAFVSATSTHLVWLHDDSCVGESGGCSVHVTDLRDGADVLIPLPEHAGDAQGRLSPDGSMLALTLIRGDDHETAHAHLIAVSDGVVHRVAGATISVRESAPLVVWTDDSRGVVLGSVTQQRLALAVLGRDRSLRVLRREFPPAYDFVVRPSRR